MELQVVAYDDPDAQKLIAEVMQEYVARYGGQDVTPVDPADFAPPRGLFLLGRVDGVPVACGGWRAHDHADGGVGTDGDSGDGEYRDGDAEIKRMYVVPSARGHGYARAMLAELERTARAEGRLRCVLETGLAQPEAIALYTSAGYTRIPGFGVYRCEPDSRCYAKML